MSVYLIKDPSPKNTARDMSVDQDFTVVVQGDKITDYRLIIMLNSTSAVLYDTTQTILTTPLYDGDTLTITVPALSISNDQELKWTLQTWENASTSTPLEEIFFYSYTDPELTLDSEEFYLENYYPEDYGAVGDGVTDDTAAFQLAIDAVTVSGAVHLGEKSYAIGSRINMKDNVTLIGAGDTSILKPIADTEIIWFLGATCNNTKLKDFKIESTQVGALDTYGLVGADGTIIDGLIIDGITFNCPDMYRNAVFFKANSTAYVQNIEIMNCHVLGAGRMGFEMIGNDGTSTQYADISCHDNIIESCGQGGTLSIGISFVQQCERVDIFRNTLIDNTQYQIEIGGGSDVVNIYNNAFYGDTGRIIIDNGNATIPLTNLHIYENACISGNGGYLELRGTINGIVEDNSLLIDFVYLKTDTTGTIVRNNNIFALGSHGCFTDNASGNTYFNNYIEDTGLALNTVLESFGAGSTGNLFEDNISFGGNTIFGETGGASGNTSTNNTFVLSADSKTSTTPASVLAIIAANAGGGSTFPSVITEQSYEFIATWFQAEGLPAKKFQAFLYDSSENIIDQSDLIENANTRYEFDGFIDGNDYGVSFIAFDEFDRSADTGIENFTVDYAPANINITPTTTVSDENGSITVAWGTVTIINGVETGVFTYSDDFVYLGDKAVNIPAAGSLEYTLDIPVEFTVEFTLELPTGFTGVVVTMDSGSYDFGYDGTQFYADINGVLINILTTTITSKKWYIGLRPDSVYIEEIV